MTFSYLIGLFSNISLDIMPWIFVIIIVLLVMIGSSTAIYYRKMAPMKKSMLILGYTTFWLLTGGILGLFISSITYLIVHAFVSDFKSNYE